MEFLVSLISFLLPRTQLCMQMLCMRRDDGKHGEHCIAVSHGMEATNFFGVHIPHWLQELLLRMLDVARQPEVYKPVLEGKTTKTEQLVHELGEEEVTRYWKGIKEMDGANTPMLTIRRDTAAPRGRFFRLDSYDEFWKGA